MSPMDAFNGTPRSGYPRTLTHMSSMDRRSASPSGLQHRVVAERKWVLGLQVFFEFPFSTILISPFHIPLPSDLVPLNFGSIYCNELQILVDTNFLYSIRFEKSEGQWRL